MKTKILFFFGLILLFSCCDNKQILFIESINGKEIITVITMGNIRYISDGKHIIIPKENYVKLDISKVSSIGDQIGICWNDNGKKWKLVNDESILLENKLDESLYSFQKELDKTDIGAPTFKNYLGENCIRVSPRENRVYPPNGVKLIYY